MAFGREECMKKERNSSIEMLRILAMLGIVIMHANGAVMAWFRNWICLDTD